MTIPVTKIIPIPLLRYTSPEPKEGYVESQTFEGLWQESDETFKARVREYSLAHRPN